MDIKQEKLAKLCTYLDADPFNLRLLLECAELARTLGDTRAMTWSEQALAIAPTDPRPNLLAGTIALDLQQFAQAAAHFQQVLSAGHDVEAVRHNLALALMLQGSPNEALTVLKPVVDIESPSFGALMLYARIAYHCQHFEDAENCLLLLVTEHPTLIEAKALLALLYADLGKNTLAITVLVEQVLLEDANNYEALLAHASVALQEVEIEKAIARFQHIVQMHPNSGRALLGLGLATLTANDSANAESILRQATKYLPADISSWNALGWSQLAQSKLADAETSFRQAITIDNNSSESHDGLACVLLLAGRKNEAEAERIIGKGLGDPALPKFADIIALTMDENEENINEAAAKLRTLSSMSFEGVSVAQLLGKLKLEERFGKKV